MIESDVEPTLFHVGEEVVALIESDDDATSSSTVDGSCGSMSSDDDATSSDVYRCVENREIDSLPKHASFIHRNGVYTIEQTRNDRETPGSIVVYSGVYDPDGNRFEQYTGVYSGVWNRSRTVMVTRIEPAPEIDPETRIKCTACGRRFTFHQNGPRYVEHAREHVRTEHVEDGELDDRAVQGLLDVVSQ